MGEDALQKLEAALRPIEKYAVRFLEEVRYTLRTVLAQTIDTASLVDVAYTFVWGMQNFTPAAVQNSPQQVKGL